MLYYRTKDKAAAGLRDAFSERKVSARARAFSSSRASPAPEQPSQSSQFYKVPNFFGFTQNHSRLGNATGIQLLFAKCRWIRKKMNFYFANKRRQLFWIRKPLYLIWNSLFIWKITLVWREKGKNWRWNRRFELLKYRFANKTIRLLQSVVGLFVTRI